MAISYIVYAPDYVGNSAGIRALYMLADRLNRKGYRTYVTGTGKTDITLRAPRIPCFLAAAYTRVADLVAVYGEGVSGNPLDAKRVARWVLNRPGLLGGDQVYDSNERVFTYSDVYSNYITNPIAGKLFMPTIDQSIFFPDERSAPTRTREYYYVGKSTFKSGFFDRHKAIEITRSTPPKKQLGALFRSAKVLYCFDNSTILAYEAAMCGCPVVIIPDGTQSHADYKKYELGTNGIAWGLEELGRARETVHLLPPFLEKAKLEFEKQLDEFIAITSSTEQFTKPNLDRLNSLRSSGAESAKCPQCDDFRKEIELIYEEVDIYERSRYLKVRRYLKQRFPALHRLVALGGMAVFFVDGILENAKLRRRMARRTVPR